MIAYDESKKFIVIYNLMMSCKKIIWRHKYG